MNVCGILTKLYGYTTYVVRVLLKFRLLIVLRLLHLHSQDHPQQYHQPKDHLP
jgi:hypothetical protein